MVLTVTLNPSVDRAVFIQQLKVGDTNRVVRTETDAGGKGVNLSRVLRELGGETVATGFLGGGAGAYICKVLDLQSVPHCFVEVAGNTRTNFSVEDEAQNPPTTFNERGPEVTDEDIHRLFDRVREYLPRITWLAMGGSLPPGASADIFRKLVELAHEHGIKALVDADGEAMKLAMLARPDFIKPNEKEASRLLDRELSGRNDSIEAAQELYRQLGGDGKVAVVSRGAGGAVLACGEGEFDGMTPNVEMRSTIGCGDSMLGGMLWAMGTGMSLEEAFRWGLASGAATAATDGTEIARRPVVEKLVPLARIERD
ncbi:MAG: 1-phosphofructokinase family hexose kinase [Chlorobia bacterium]|nr:1-phosphofructokinase family hexose kinase [Fimbriimonadaceae bacterium]